MFTSYWSITSIIGNMKNTIGKDFRKFQKVYLEHIKFYLRLTYQTIDRSHVTTNL